MSLCKLTAAIRRSLCSVAVAAENSLCLAFNHIALNFNHIACSVAFEPTAQLDACSVALQLQAEVVKESSVTS